ncbi:cytochrome P450 [Saccharothrix coeruleofusca]|uniref:cytochrome P450 n=1 Tax=Saccharothrix coeruleofusca TaxID=33919 RepID=UPI001AE60120|nr:cytochrome P450 [Saccharothrix coeruleofusca]MBP2335283.1 cytochrome P450 [Saccharothrix coeruleofusca]
MAVASRADTARVFARVLLPTLAKGVILRRPGVVAAAEKLRLDGSAVRTVRRMRERYGPEPLRLRVTGRSFALLLDPADVRRLLDQSPEPFALATKEKRAALGHFQPHGVLASRGAARERRREFNEQALRPDRRCVDVVRDEVDLLVRHAASTGVLDWDSFAQAWWRAVRRIVLGDAARQDQALTDDLAKLRAAANWAYLRPRREALRRDVERRLARHLERNADALAPPEMVGQVPHWLFAFDAAGIATMRALAVGGSDRWAVLESVRLWPTTPVILRESTIATRWHGSWLPEGTTFVVFTPYFHRDATRLPFADRFAPEVWREGTTDPALVPFSGGPGVCPGRDLVLETAGEALAVLRSQLEFGPPLREPLPPTLNHFGLRFPVHRSG